jgi:hypothetical protein
MTPPPDPSELASALVDGALSADDAARASADPEVAALAREFEALRSELRAMPPAPDIGRSTAVSAALDAVASDASRGAPGPPPAAQAPYPAQQRSGRPWLIAVASVILLVLAVGVISQLGGDNSEDLNTAQSDESADTADDAPTDSPDDLQSEEFDTNATEQPRDESADGATGEEPTGGAGDAEESGENEVVVADVIDLGPVEDVDELVAAVGAGASAEAPAPQAEPNEDLEERDDAARE